MFYFYLGIIPSRLINSSLYRSRINHNETLRLQNEKQITFLSSVEMHITTYLVTTKFVRDTFYKTDLYKSIPCIYASNRHYKFSVSFLLVLFCCIFMDLFISVNKIQCRNSFYIRYTFILFSFYLRIMSRRREVC